MAEQGKKTAFTAGEVARAAGGRLDSWTSAGFFPALPPQAPVAQETQGRRYDYNQSFNIIRRPRTEEPGGASFELLRNLADNYDLLRLVIETRKDQLCGLSWNIVARNSEDKIDGDDKRVQELEKFFRRPDGMLTWNEWLRELVEDLLVIDAPTIYPRQTLGGGLHSLEVMDGATIKILVDETGRVPMAPAPAYAQVLKGMPASHYTRDELIYKPRNRRSWKQYGFSPVEQIMMTVNIALRRQISQLNYYTEGNVPEALVSCPAEWTPEMVGEMQVTWDSLMTGQAEIKRQMKFVPGGMEVQFTREPTMKDAMDEWLARIVAYAFSVSPQALIQMMNRATAESAAETAQLEGLAPLQLWVKDLIDDIIENKFGYDDLVFEWDSGEELDPKAQAEIHAIYLTNGVVDIDEVRKDIGRDPRMSATAEPNSGAVPVLDGGVRPPEGQSAAPAGAVAAAGAAPETNPDGSPVEPQLGPDGQPLAPVPGAPVVSEAKVADAAMNGAQVSSLLEIVSMVAAKDLPEGTAEAIMMAAFPAIPPETIKAMLVPLQNFEPPKPEPIVGPDGNPIAPGVPPAADGEPVKPTKGKEADADAEPPVQPKAKTDKEEKVEKALKPAQLARKQRKQLTDAMRKKLAELGKDIARQVIELREESVAEEFAKAKDSQDSNVRRLLAKFNISFEDIEESLLASLEVVSTVSATAALKQLKVAGSDALSLANTAAEKWAKARAAELIKSNSAGGELAEATRDMLRSTIVQAEAEGWSNQHLAKELEGSYAFSKQRAETIARTELKAADSEGAIAGWRSTGLKLKKEWVRSANDADCDICADNEADGQIDLDASFSSGDDTSPAHPNCECAVLPVIEEEN